MRAILLLLCTTAGLALAATASSGEPGVPERFRDALLVPDLEAATALVRGKSAAALVKDPVALRTVLAHARLHLSRLIVGTKDPAPARALLEALGTCLRLAAAAHPDDGGVKDALADHVLLEIRLACRHERRPKTAEAFTRCTSSSLRAEARKRPHLAPWLLDRADQVCRVARMAVDDTGLRREHAVVIHTRMLLDWEAGDVAAVLAGLARLKEVLEPLLKVPTKKKEGPHFYWNWGVALARSASEGCQEPYLTRRIEVARRLYADLPLGFFEDRMVGLFRLGHARFGGRSFEMRILHCYPDVGYDLDKDDERAEGVNLKGLVEEARRAARQRIANVTKEKRLGGNALAPRWKPVRGFDMRGTSKEGRQLRCRAWIFRADDNQVTYVVLAQTDAGHPGMDDVVDFVVASLREKAD